MVFNYLYENVDIKVNAHRTRFCNNHHQIRSRSNNWKAK